jgi:hypothetical protein
MSLATSPTRPHLEYAVRLSDSDYKRAFASLRPGDDVIVFGPIGDFVLHETRPAILVAGGIGITPSKAWPNMPPTGRCPFPSGLSTAPQRGRNCLSRRTRCAGKAEPTIPCAPHAYPSCRSWMAGRDRTDRTKPSSATGSRTCGSHLLRERYARHGRGNLALATRGRHSGGRHRVRGFPRLRVELALQSPI